MCSGQLVVIRRELLQWLIRGTHNLHDLGEVGLDLYVPELLNVRVGTGDGG